MDGDLIQALAFILFALVTGAASFFSKMREAQKKKEMEREIASSEKMSPRPPARKNASLPPYKTLSPKEQPSESSPNPPQETKSAADTLREIFRDLFDEPLPEPIPMEPSPAEWDERQKKKKLKQKAVKKQAQAVEQPAPPPIPTKKDRYISTLAPVVKAESQGRKVLRRYMDMANENPLRAAIILSEIIQPPVCLRPRKMPPSR